MGLVLFVVKGYFLEKKKLYNSKEIFLHGCREKKCEFDEL